MIGHLRAVDMAERGRLFAELTGARLDAVLDAWRGGDPALLADALDALDYAARAVDR